MINFLAQRAGMTWQHARREIERWANGESLDTRYGHGIDRELGQRATRASQENRGADVHNRRARHVNERRRFEGENDIEGEAMEAEGEGMNESDMRPPGSQGVGGSMLNTLTSQAYGSSGGGFTSSASAGNEEQLYDFPSERLPQPGASPMDNNSTVTFSRESPLSYQEIVMTTGDIIPLLPTTFNPLDGPSVPLGWRGNIFFPAPDGQNNETQNDIWNLLWTSHFQDIITCVPDWFNGNYADPDKSPPEFSYFECVDHRPFWNLNHWGNIQPMFALNRHNNTDIWAAHGKYKSMRVKTEFIIEDIFDWHQSATGKNFVQARNKPDIFMLEVTPEIMSTQDRWVWQKVFYPDGSTRLTVPNVTPAINAGSLALTPVTYYKVKNSFALRGYEINKGDGQLWTGKDFVKDFGWSKKWDTHQEVLQGKDTALMFPDVPKTMSDPTMKSEKYCPSKWKQYCVPRTLMKDNINKNEAQTTNGSVTVPLMNPLNIDITKNPPPLIGTWNTRLTKSSPTLHCLHDPLIKVIPIIRTWDLSSDNFTIPAEALHMPQGNRSHILKDNDLFKTPCLLVRNVADTDSMTYTAKYIWKLRTTIEFSDPVVQSEDAKSLGEPADDTQKGVFVSPFTNKPSATPGSDNGEQVRKARQIINEYHKAVDHINLFNEAAEKEKELEVIKEVRVTEEKNEPIKPKIKERRKQKHAVRVDESE